MKRKAGKFYQLHCWLIAVILHVYHVMSEFLNSLLYVTPSFLIHRWIIFLISNILSSFLFQIKSTSFVFAEPRLKNLQDAQQTLCCNACLLNQNCFLFLQYSEEIEPAQLRHCKFYLSHVVYITLLLYELRKI